MENGWNEGEALAFRSRADGVIMGTTSPYRIRDQPDEPGIRSNGPLPTC